MCPRLTNAYVDAAVPQSFACRSVLHVHVPADAKDIEKMIYCQSMSYLAPSCALFEFFDLPFSTGVSSELTPEASEYRRHGRQIA